jgi:hypothetical protein
MAEKFNALHSQISLQYLMNSDATSVSRVAKLCALSFGYNFVAKVEPKLIYTLWLVLYTPFHIIKNSYIEMGMLKMIIILINYNSSQINYTSYFK